MQFGLEDLDILQPTSFWARMPSGNSLEEASDSLSLMVLLCRNDGAQALRILITGINLKSALSDRGRV